MSIILIDSHINRRILSAWYFVRKPVSKRAQLKAESVREKTDKWKFTPLGPHCDLRFPNVKPKEEFIVKSQNQKNKIRRRICKSVKCHITREKFYWGKNIYNNQEKWNIHT